MAPGPRCSLKTARRLAVRAGAPWRRAIRRVLAARGVEAFGDTVRVAPRDTHYDAWLAQAAGHVPVYEGLSVQDVRTQHLQAWPAMGDGVTGLYLRLGGYQMTDGCILELPPGGVSAPRRHMYEASVYCFGGPGHTTLHQDDGPGVRIDWHHRSLFSIPLNARFQHANDGDRPARLVVVTSLPFIMNATNSREFVDTNPFRFTDRLNPAGGGPAGPVQIEGWLTSTAAVADAVADELAANDARGPGNASRHWIMSGNAMISLHVSEMPGRMRKRAHRHSSEAFVLALSGEGYSVMWPAGDYGRRVRIDWQEGTIFAVPCYWYHQHLNPGPAPARYLAMSASDLTTRLGLRFSDQLETDLPEIEAEWHRELAARADAPRRG